MNKLDVFGGPAVIVDDDVSAMLANRPTLWLGGRFGVLIDNRFIDLAAWLGGLGAKTGNDTTDYRKSNIFVPSVTLELEAVGPVLKWQHNPIQDRPLVPLPRESPIVETGHTLSLREGGVQYVDYEKSRSMPNIAVDSIANEGTVITLSHWPNNDTPPSLKTDLSAKSVFIYLETEKGLDNNCAVTTEHFDLDGLVSAYTFMNFDRASAHRQLLIEVAAYGDFRRTRDETALKIAMSLEGINNPAQGLLEPSVYRRGSKRRCHEKFKKGLLLLDEILSTPSINDFHALWKDDFERYLLTEAVFKAKKISLKENHTIDFACFQIETSMSKPAEIDSNHMETYLGYSIPSFHNRTNCKNTLIYCNGYVELHQRYEGWVDLGRSVVDHRQDLAALADLLNRIEDTGQPNWHYHGVVEIIPCLYTTKPSRIDVDTLYKIIATYLADCPAAWVPT